MPITLNCDRNTAPPRYKSDCTAVSGSAMTDITSTPRACLTETFQRFQSATQPGWHLHGRLTQLPGPSGISRGSLRSVGKLRLTLHIFEREIKRLRLYKLPRQAVVGVWVSQDHTCRALCRPCCVVPGTFAFLAMKPQKDQTGWAKEGRPRQWMGGLLPVQLLATGWDNPGMGITLGQSRSHCGGTGAMIFTPEPESCA